MWFLPDPPLTAHGNIIVWVYKYPSGEGVFGSCKKCGRREELGGGLCENCRLEIEGKRHMQLVEEKRERQSREEIERDVAEHRRDKRFWTG